MNHKDVNTAPHGEPWDAEQRRARRRSTFTAPQRTRTRYGERVLDTFEAMEARRVGRLRGDGEPGHSGEDE